MNIFSNKINIGDFPFFCDLIRDAVSIVEFNSLLGNTPQLAAKTLS